MRNEAVTTKRTQMGPLGRPVAAQGEGGWGLGLGRKGEYRPRS